MAPEIGQRPDRSGFLKFPSQPNLDSGVISAFRHSESR
jgi:hypothetical protein